MNESMTNTIGTQDMNNFLTIQYEKPEPQDDEIKIPEV